MSPTPRAFLAIDEPSSDLVRTDDQRYDWRRGLPLLTDGTVVLRELRAGDAPSLLTHLNRASVLRYIDRCPSTIGGFRRFIRWTHAQRCRRSHICYGIVPRAEGCVVGIVQMWPIEKNFSTAEWGFAVSDAHWGTGLFVRAAGLFLDTAFTEFGVLRLEARAVDANGRGNGVLRKLGATCEGVMRAGFRHDSEVRDHLMWSILATEWPALSHRTRAAS